MFRLLSRDRLKDAEIRLWTTNAAENSSVADSEYLSGEFQPLDLLNLAPYCVLLAAQERAERIIADAEAQEGQIHTEAAVQGAVRGREEAKQELLPSLTAFANAGQSLIVFEQQMIERYAPQLVRFALEIATKIVGKMVEEDPQITASVLERAQGEVSDAKEMRILLHPADHTALAGLAAELVRMGSQRGRQIEVVAAEDIGRGGCRLETEIGVVDATIPVQLDEIRRQLLDEEMSPQETAEASVVKSA